MLSVGQKYPVLRVVNDQIGTPTYTYDLARLLVDMIETEKYGYYHATNEGGYISWADFAKEIFAQAGMDTQVTPVTTAEYAQPHTPFLIRKNNASSVGFQTKSDAGACVYHMLRLCLFGKVLSSSFQRTIPDVGKTAYLMYNYEEMFGRTRQWIAFPP